MAGMVQDKPETLLKKCFKKKREKGSIFKENRSQLEGAPIVCIWNNFTIQN